MPDDGKPPEQNSSTEILPKPPVYDYDPETGYPVRGLHTWRYGRLMRQDHLAAPKRRHSKGPIAARLDKLTG
jgi:hypothetical protein